MLDAGPDEGADDANNNRCERQPPDEDEKQGNPDEEAMDASESGANEAAAPQVDEDGVFSRIM